MQTGRKILNLRRDRKISQQDLAKACDITPSALSKIESGINSPRARIIWRLARKLGVTVEYLLDEDLPYPYAPYSYLEELQASAANSKAAVKMEVSREERAFLEALRKSSQVAREVVLAIPSVSVETLRMIHFLVHHARIRNASGRFFSDFEKMVHTASDVPGKAPAMPDRKARRSVKPRV
jgi:transcriptional regulator with XRE-family HTH domain